MYSEEDDTSETRYSEDSEEDEEKEEDEDMENTTEQSDDEDVDDSEEADLRESEGSEDSEDAESSFDTQDQSDRNTDANESSNKQENFIIQTMSETNVKAEVEKGGCVRNQLKLWENLLEMRIKLQKCIVTSNQMPQCDTHTGLRSDPNFVKKVNETKSKLALVLNNMLQLQDLLLKQYPETKNLRTTSKKRKIEENGNEDANEDDPMDEEIPSDTENELESEKESSANEDTEKTEETVPRKLPRYNDYEKNLQEGHTAYTEYRDSVIRKWNDKTRIATGTLNKSTGQTTLKQIEFAMSNMSKLRKKTQLKRSEYSILGKPAPVEDNDGSRIQEYDPEIFDDDDFYHQLLRDLIEYKSSNVTDPVQLSRQWIQLQNMRRKMKKKVDTRATKGRKVRYSVHNKLVNFMAPITVYDTWTDTAKNELYSSLFGKIKSTKEQTK